LRKLLRAALEWVVSLVVEAALVAKIPAVESSEVVDVVVGGALTTSETATASVAAVLAVLAEETVLEALVVESLEVLVIVAPVDLAEEALDLEVVVTQMRTGTKHPIHAPILNIATLDGH